MTVTAQSVCRRVVTILQDTSSVRWTLNEIVRALNDGQLAMLDARPDLFTSPFTLTCVAGIRQTIPVAGAKLLRVMRNNSDASKRSIRIAVMEHLDAQVPDWQGMEPVDEVAHYMVDQRDPRAFYVYPPATVNAKLDLYYVAYPTVIAQPGEGVSLPADPASDPTAPTAVVGNVSCPDELATTALVDFILYRLFVKNSNAGDLQRATAHYQAFAAALGAELQGKLASGPVSNSPLNPLYPAISQPRE